MRPDQHQPASASGAVPATKAARHALITRVLAREPIRSQGELAVALGE